MNIEQDGITIQKTPAGAWDVTVNWGCPSRDLGADTIASSAWTFSGDDNSLVLNQEEISQDGKMTTVWLSGGTVGAYYQVTNTITTTNQRILTGTFIVQVLQYIYLTQPHYI